MRELWVLSQFIPDPITGQLVAAAADYSNGIPLAPANPLPVVSSPALGTSVAGTFATPPPGNQVDTASSASGGTGWSNASLISATSGTDAFFTFGAGPGTLTSTLVTATFTPTIPSNSVVTGFQVDFERMVGAAGATTTTFQVQLLIQNVAQSTTFNSGTWPVDGAYHAESHGGSTNMWGGTATTAQVLNGSAPPQVTIQLQTNATGGITTHVRNLRLTIFYTSPLTGSNSITVTAGQTLVATVGWTYPTGSPLVLPTLTDTQGNFWNALDSDGGPTDASAVGQYRIALYYARNLPSSGSLTVTATPDPTATGISVGLVSTNTTGTLASHGTGGSSVTTGTGESLVVTSSFGTGASNVCSVLTTTGGLTSISGIVPNGGSGTSTGCSAKFAYGVVVSPSTINIAMTGSTAQYQVWAVFNPLISDGEWGLVLITADPPQVDALRLDARIIYCGTVWDTPPSTVLTVYASYLLGTETLMGQVLNELGNNLDARFSPV